ncbi:hypothetical protein HMPREF0063_10430 [Aeromicrobium marinum DSM 15272]|uniref:Tat pathway signal sequence domain protein n=1 Tax=Aeromicrobium marinum DSM 15272 TaxID=585531 RepID=E2S8S3_9ACTN|nr:hypothetical protein [Aeromicrobium marinum]EFQ84578.1 hypothetical protein HMPREF0063_10430 [Aeromicrobium marinum DSM 15272]
MTASEVPGDAGSVSPRRLTAAVGAVVLLASLTACGGETAGGTSTTTVDQPGPGVTVSAGDDSVTSGGTLPEDFPEDAVSFPLGFDVTMAQERNVGGSTAWLVLGLVRDPISPVRESLATLYGEPDTETGDASFPDGVPVVMTWNDHEGYELTFTLTSNDDGDTAVTALVKPRTP